MPKYILPVTLAVIFSFVLLGKYSEVYAATCQGSVSPASITNNGGSTLSFSVTNDGPETAVWAQVYNTGANYWEITGGSASGWSVQATADSVYFTGGSLGSGQTATFAVNVTVEPDDLETGTFQIFLALTDGNADWQCSGSMGVTASESVGVPSASASPSPSTSTTTTTTTTTVTASPTPTPKPLVDTVAPSVTIETDFSKPFEEVPLISGKAVDSGAINVGVAKVEYSIDEGKNWSPVDSMEGEGKSVKFGFTPVIFEDGDYQIKVRAKDNSGNTGSSKVYKLVIDRLPPQVSGILTSIGGQVISPRPDGTIIVLEGLDIKITLSAVGGPINIDIISLEGSVSSLVKNTDSGLWSGTLSFAEPGNYTLTAKSVDGAENTTERRLNDVIVLPSGRIRNETGAGLSGVQVTLFYLEPTSNSFVVWDGSAFGQENPQKTDSEGRYKLLVPPGKYYLQVSGKGYKTLRSEIFSIYSTISINSVFNLKAAVGFRIGQWFFGIPDFKSESVKVTLPVITTETKNALVGSEMPFFEFDKGVSTTDLRGKPIVYTFVASWSPPTYDEIPVLEGLTLASKEIKTVLVMSQETWSKIQTFKKLGGYQTEILTDSDGKLVVPLGILNYPTHVFVDRKGIIKNIKVGVLTKNQILENLVN